LESLNKEENKKTAELILSLDPEFINILEKLRKKGPISDIQLP
jgi:hypothetical protein